MSDQGGAGGHKVIETLVAFVQAIRTARKGPRTLETVQAWHQALVAARDALEAAGEPLGVLLFDELADDIAGQVKALEAQAVKQAEQEAATVARVAAELDGPAVALDGGPSDPLLSVAEWVASIERWAAGRTPA